MAESLSMALGTDGVADFIEQLHSGLADLRVEIDDILGTEDRVAVREPNVGTLFGVEATGRDVEFSAINIHRIHDGRIGETWQHIDWHSALAVLGVGES